MTPAKPELQIVARDTAPLARGGNRRVARLIMPVAGTEWLLREAPDIRVQNPACEIAGTFGDQPFRLLVDPALVDACLERAPDPVRLPDLLPPDAALLCEHVMSSAITLLERMFGKHVTFHSIHIVPQSSHVPGAGFEVNAGQGWSAVQLFTEDRETMRSIGAAFDRLEAEGPRGVPGLPIMVGPIFLPRDEAPLAAGEQLILVEGPASALSGAVFLDLHLEWPVNLMKEHFEVLGTLAETHVAQWDERRTLYLEWGHTLAHATMRPGEKQPYTASTSEVLSLFENNTVIARCRLVTVGQGMALEIVEPERRA